MNNYRIDNLQYCNWSKEVFQINNEAKLDAVHVTIAYHEDFNEVKKNCDIIFIIMLILVLILYPNYKFNYIIWMEIINHLLILREKK